MMYGASPPRSGMLSAWRLPVSQSMMPLSSLPRLMAVAALGYCSSGPSFASLLGRPLTSTCGAKDSDLTKWPKSFLMEITDNFSDQQKLREGTFGTVYQGNLPKGGMIAVKKLREHSKRPHEFEREVLKLNAIKHKNIVKLVGYCYESQRNVVNNHRETFLCYEYLPRSLDKYPFESHGNDWDTRFNIIKGICMGVQFLHKGMNPLVVLKPDNILLDDEMAPKISDFGLSRIFGPKQTRMYTQNIVGALGYLAPEYNSKGEISTRADIYSLGVLIIQISTLDKTIPNDRDQFIRQARQKLEEPGHTLCCPTFDAGRLNERKRCLEIGLECMELDSKKRPTIADIIDRLNGKIRARM